MAATKKSTARNPRPKKCQGCDGTGETTETVRIGGRKKHDTAHRQTGMCVACWGTGTAPE